MCRRSINQTIETDLTRRARRFAAEAHSAIDQRRKYTNEPYIVHPVSVSLIVGTVSDDPEVLAAALLHDVVEDTPCTHAHICRDFGRRVSELVFYLTNVSCHADGNRRYRKTLDRAHIAMGPPESKTIKLADIIDNTRSIAIHDADFAKVYLAEKQAALDVCREGHPELLRAARKTIEDQVAYLERLRQSGHGLNADTYSVHPVLG